MKQSVFGAYLEVNQAPSNVVHAAEYAIPALFIVVAPAANDLPQGEGDDQRRWRPPTA